MTYRLRENLYCCASGDEIIFLDLERDRYFRLPTAAEEAVRKIAAGRGGERENQLLESLVAGGLLVWDSGVAGMPMGADVPATTGDAAGNAIGSTWRLAAQALKLELMISLKLRRSSLMEVLRDLRALRPHGATRNHAAAKAIPAIAAAFATTATLLGAADRCLVRALAATALCYRQGIAVSLVFGVRTKPYAAHCWVQLDGLVVVGDHEQVRLFTPILAVR